MSSLWTRGSYWTRWDNAASGRLVTVGHVVRAGVREHVRLDDIDRLFVDLAVYDPVGAQLVPVRVAGGNQHIVRVGQELRVMAGVRDVRTRRVSLGRGMRVVHDDRLLVGGLHP